MRKTVNGATTIFAYDESDHLLGEYAATGALIREYVWLGDIPVAVITGGAGTPRYVFWYLHADHLNTPRSVENPTTGELVWRWDSAPFGEMQPNQDPDGDFEQFTFPLRFPGQYADSETGLHYNYFRDYEPRTGRYVQSDPIGLAGGTDTYSYILGNPLWFSDPLGLVPGGAPGAIPTWRPPSRIPAPIRWGGRIGGRLLGLVGAGILAYDIYEMCKETSEEARCRKVYKDCADRCADIYADSPDELPGIGADFAPRARRCIAGCVKAAGCSPFQGR